MKMITPEFDSNEIERYRRHFSINEIGHAGQKKLKASSVLCIGAGGIGSPALYYLAACGLGRIGIVDNDQIDLSNLQRQILFNESDIGHEKTEAAKKKLTALNQHTEIITHTERLTIENAKTILSDYDIVLDGSDNFATKYLANDACHHLRKPLVSASLSQFSGQLSTFNLADGPCYRCLYSTPPSAGSTPNCSQAGVLGVIPGILGTMAALEVIKLALTLPENLSGRLMVFDGLKFKLSEFSIKKSDHCELCVGKKTLEELHGKESPTISAKDLHTMTDNNEEFVLLDVRELWEREARKINNSIHIPLNELTDADIRFNKQSKIIAYCESGKRSASAVKLLKAMGYHQALSLDSSINEFNKKLTF